MWLSYLKKKASTLFNHGLYDFASDWKHQRSEYTRVYLSKTAALHKVRLNWNRLSLKHSKCRHLFLGLSS